MVTLRDYQQSGVDKIRASFMKGHRRVMAIAPPGAGKGTVICKLAVDAAMKRKRCLIAVHRPDLLDGPNSISVRLEEQFEFFNYGWYMAGKPKGEKPVMLGSKDTMIRRKLSQNIDLVIIDECHRVASLTYQKLLAKFPNAYIIGFTATPFRGDKKTFENDFDDLIQMATYNELVAKGKLVKTRAIAPDIDLDLTGLHLRGGDFKNDELLERYDNERIYTGIVNKWKELSGSRKTIFFTVNSMKHCNTLAKYFQDAGVDARAITSKTSREERTKMLEEFEANKYPVLINIGLFTEGLSIDDVETIAFAVATRSPTKYFQAATRGSRPVFNAAGVNVKDHCLILDFGGNTERHGFVDDYDLIPFTLEGTPPRSKEAHMKVCPKCEEVVFVQTKKCPGCGYEFPVKIKIDEKMYVDEVEFREIQRAKSLYKKIVELDYSKIEQALIQNPKPEIIRAIGMIKGYNQFWAVHTAYRMGYLGWVGRKPVSLKDKHRVIRWLKDQEKEKGYAGVVEQLKDKLL